jgi:chemotaxis signal transduction protein/HPt (histidine-containing phosphotransfer) domain-containing protein
MGINSIVRTDRDPTRTADAPCGVSSRGGTARLCLVGVAGRTYGVPLSDGFETLDPSMIVPAIGGPPWLAGTVLVGDDPLPVVDLRVRLELPTPGWRLRAQLVVAGEPGRAIALEVDHAKAIITVPFDSMDPLGQPLRAEQPFLTVARQPGTSISVLDVDRLRAESDVALVALGNGIGRALPWNVIAGIGRYGRTPVRPEQPWIAAATDLGSEDDVEQSEGAAGPGVLAVFQAETHDHIASARRVLTALAVTEPTTARLLLDDLEHEVHALKVGAGAVGLTTVRTLASSLEMLLDRIRLGEVRIPPATFELTEDVLKLVLALVDEACRADARVPTGSQRR